MLAAGALLAWHAAAAAQERDRSTQLVSEFPLTGDDGQRLPNHSVKLLGPIDQLPGVVTVGNPGGKATLIEFYDLNCPFCRIASADIADMVDVDPQLKLVLVPFPVLGVASIAGVEGGVQIAEALPQHALQRLFGVLMLAVAGQIAVRAWRKPAYPS